MKDDMERITQFVVILLLILLCSSASAIPYYGGRFAYAPLHRSIYPHGYQLMLFYDPQYFQWRTFNIYFDAGFSQFWSDEKPYYRRLNIYSAAPIIHFSFKRRGPVLPFLELSIGVAYLDHTRIDHRNLGIHFAFQDRFGIGVAFGKNDRFNLSIQIVHYSNGGLCVNNSGITAPEINLNYRLPIAAN